ncbi:MAG: hypothetical protein WBC33_12490 [Conexibacter sp.]
MPSRLLASIALMALLVPAALAAKPKPVKTYKGTTEGGSAVTVKVKDGRVTSFKASVDAACGLSSLLITIAYPPTGVKKGTSAPIRNGAFKVTYRSDPSLDPEDDKRTLSGTFGKHGRLTGAIKVRGLCSADETYSATRR